MNTWQKADHNRCARARSSTKKPCFMRLRFRTQSLVVLQQVLVFQINGYKNRKSTTTGIIFTKKPE